jgi:uncharacterized protein YaeQ
MRTESSITSITWIPSEAIKGMPKLPFEWGVAHYDEPPPDRLIDIDAMHENDMFREANELTAWIEVGMPAPDRLHKATKAVDRVIVFPHRPVELFLRQCEGARIHKAESIRIVALEPALLRALEPTIDRNVRWDVSIHDGHLFVTVGAQAFGSTIEEHRLGSA